MIKLGLPKEAYWLDLPQGVRVKVRPLDTAMFETARALGQKLAREVLQEFKAIKENGGRVENMPDLSTPEGEEGVSQFQFTKALMLGGILEWQGVSDLEGANAPVTPETIHEFAMIHLMAEDFTVRYTAHQTMLVYAGKD